MNSSFCLKSVVAIFLLFWKTGFAQSEKDIILYEKIFPLLLTEEKQDYFEAKYLLLELQRETGYLPQEIFRLLGDSYEHGDLLFFKTNLIRLTEEYGFNLALLSKNTSYHYSLTSGSLSEWFKSVYPQSRAKWLKENYWKIPYLKELNDLHIKARCSVGNFGVLLREAKDEKTKKEVKRLFVEEYKSNFEELLWICEQIGGYPSAKSFALRQTPWFLAAFHILLYPDYTMEYLKKIMPYWEKAYLNGNMDYIVFKNFDIRLFITTGKQYFGLIEVEDIPENILKQKGVAKTGIIPIVDPEGLAKRREKLGWE